MTGIVEATAAYEKWLGAAIPLVADDIDAKHVQLASNELRFMRGTYYYWLQSMARLLPELISSSPVALVGDLHVENFGTWRDAHGARRWGVNDLDELGHGPYPVDLVRLATSYLLVPGLVLGRKQLCALLLETWHSAEPSHAVNLDHAENHHLKHLVPAPHGDSYYRDLVAGAAAPDASIPAEVTAAAIAGVPAWHPSWHSRRAGTGSLGHPRYVAVGTAAHDEMVAREVKLLGPPSASWLGLTGFRTDDALYERVQTKVRGASPAFRVDDWQVRRLAPDVVRIEIGGLARHDEERVITSMAQAVADIHGVDSDALTKARADSARRGGSWLSDAVEIMAADTHAAFTDWKTR